MFCSLLGGAVSRALLLPPQDKLARAPASSRMNQPECCKLLYQDKRPSYIVKNHCCRADHLQPYRIGFLLHCPSHQRWAEAWAAPLTHLPPFRGEHPRREVIWGKAPWKVLLALFPQDEEKEESEGSQDGLSANFPASFRDKDVPETSVHLGRRNVMLWGGYYQEIWIRAQLCWVFNTEIVKLINISRKDWGRRESLTQAVKTRSF